MAQNYNISMIFIGTVYKVSRNNKALKIAKSNEPQFN